MGGIQLLFNRYRVIIRMDGGDGQYTTVTVVTTELYT